MHCQCPSPLLRDYEQVILDLDGCVWLGADPIPGSLEAIDAHPRGRP